MRRNSPICNLILCALLLVCVIVFLSGCRSRISDSPETDEVVSMLEGPAAVEQYEERREELDLGTAVAPLRQKPPENLPVSDASSRQASAGGGVSTSGGNGGGDGNGNGSGKKNSGNKDKDKNKKPEKQKESVTVKLDPCGGSCETEKLKVTYGKTYGSLPAAVRDGFIFRGWFTEAGGGTEVTSQTRVRSKKKHTLYAHWEEAGGEVTYTITFDANGGRITKKYATRSLHEGDAYGAFPNVYNDGYELEGWFTEPEGGEQVMETSVFGGGGDQILYAHWTYDPYTYWSYQLRNTTERMYSCQVIPCYIEFEQSGETASSCPFLSDCKAQNVAMNRGNDTSVTDEWVNGKNPKVVIKCTGGNAEKAYGDMAGRFPDKRILIAPAAAVSGTQNEQLYYKLNLGVLIYPDWYADIDLAAAAADLGVSGQIIE